MADFVTALIYIWATGFALYPLSVVFIRVMAYLRPKSKFGDARFRENMRYTILLTGIFLAIAATVVLWLLK